ncbi:uncharacterized protein EV422DRAFT_513735 [Fimicolochytrium jonesii]|uniref:uncharacterized protein n=1 Tax=Fimicolochytrium jonesii TaxID=1396493 RepID=UPI0022FE0088|nr:uncharacterized protein EV422DRAFT_513735 [Fimicolochytrium jonesii]KAI8825660.1 hypothetical protein EV422DRAFT_513735 [Fimicolochytrium jonesii]
MLTATSSANPSRCTSPGLPPQTASPVIPGTASPTTPGITSHRRPVSRFRERDVDGISQCDSVFTDASAMTSATDASASSTNSYWSRNFKFRRHGGGSIRSATSTRSTQERLTTLIKKLVRTLGVHKGSNTSERYTEGTSLSDYEAARIPGASPQLRLDDFSTRLGSTAQRYGGAGVSNSQHLAFSLDRDGERNSVDGHRNVHARPAGPRQLQSEDAAAIWSSVMKTAHAAQGSAQKAAFRQVLKERDEARNECRRLKSVNKGSKRSTHTPPAQSPPALATDGRERVPPVMSPAALSNRVKVIHARVKNVVKELDECLDGKGVELIAPIETSVTEDGDSKGAKEPSLRNVRDQLRVLMTEVEVSFGDLGRRKHQLFHSESREMLTVEGIMQNLKSAVSPKNKALLAKTPSSENVEVVTAEKPATEAQGDPHHLVSEDPHPSRSRQSSAHTLANGETQPTTRLPTPAAKENELRKKLAVEAVDQQEKRMRRQKSVSVTKDEGSSAPVPEGEGIESDDDRQRATSDGPEGSAHPQIVLEATPVAELLHVPVAAENLSSPESPTFADDLRGKINEVFGENNVSEFKPDAHAVKTVTLPCPPPRQRSNEKKEEVVEDITGNGDIAC